MLKALYDYAIRNDLALQPGFVKKTVKAYVSLSSLSDDFIAIEPGGEEAVSCPDIGSLANGKDKSNILVEKRSVIFPDEPTAKNRFFLESLRSFSEVSPAFSVCVHALENAEITEKIKEELDRHKIKPSDRLCFWVDRHSILDDAHVSDWWQSFRRQFLKSADAPSSLCLITGEPTVPVATTTPINGLSVVGGHARGDALICFDKPAFCSYGLKKAENAPVSESAFSAVKAGLDDLLAKAPILAGMKFVHWYEKDLDDSEDLIAQYFNLEKEDWEEEEEEEETPAERKQKEIDAVTQANTLIESVRSGQQTVPLDNIYHILLLTGVSGRIMVRHYERGSYENLQKNLELWHRDLELTNSIGTAFVKDCKLTGLLIRLLKFQKNSRIFNRLNKELSGIIPTVVTAILTGTELPDSVAVRALAYIRSLMLASADDENGTSAFTALSPDGRACQWLKVWLIRKKRREKKEEPLMSVYNLNHPSAAYHCGGIMAVYARIQQLAIANINASIIQRYFASASRTPALVLGQLNRLSNYHLDKLQNPRYFEQQLSDLYSALGENIPVTLTLEQQSYFVLGYYQKWAELNLKKDRSKDNTQASN